MTSIKKCEFCNKKLNTEAEVTVCRKCDLDLEIAESKDLAKREHQHAKKHKCRSCNAGPPLSRYFECPNCMPNQTSESEFELFDLEVT